MFVPFFDFLQVSAAESAKMDNPYTKTKEFPAIVGAIKSAFPQAVDCYREHHPDPVLEPGYTFDAVENSYSVFDANREKMRTLQMPPERERLDHVWLLRSVGEDRELVCTKCDVDRRQDLSDHWGVATHFEFRPIPKSKGDSYDRDSLPQTAAEIGLHERAKRLARGNEPGSFYKAGPYKSGFEPDQLD